MTQPASTTFADALREMLRYLAWMIVDGLVVVGACYSGGCAFWVHYRRRWPVIGGRTCRQADVSQAVGRGIAEIEAFLAARYPHDLTQAPTEGD